MPKQKKLNLKTETVVLTKCEVFGKNNVKVGKGYTFQRQNGFLVGNFGLKKLSTWHDEEIDNNSFELDNGWYSIRHTDEQYLAVVCWVVQ